MSEHTEGPWRYREDYDEVESQKPQLILAKVLYIPHGWDIPDSPTYQEAKANGRLMAAAPDLLDALKRVMRDKDRDGQPSLSALAMAIAQDAVDLAEGKK